jgi:hypothetical protein
MGSQVMCQIVQFSGRPFPNERGMDKFQCFPLTQKMNQESEEANLVHEIVEVAEEDPIVIKKTAILNANSNLHYQHGSYKKFVYVKIDDELKKISEILNEVGVEKISKLDWWFKFGKGGSKCEKIPDGIIQNGKFVNENDSKIDF